MPPKTAREQYLALVERWRTAIADLFYALNGVQHTSKIAVDLVKRYKFEPNALFIPIMCLVSLGVIREVANMSYIALSVGSDACR